MITRKMLLLEMFLIAGACAATLAAYPHLPLQVPTHWDIHLHPNAYAPKWALFLYGPALLAAITLFTWLGPWLSPRRFEVDNFRSTWLQLMLFVFCMIAYVYVVILLAGLRHGLDSGRMVMGGVCLVIALMGNFLGKVRKNFFIGIRTPWTLASDRVWNATHRLAARTWMVGGVLGLLFTILGFRILAFSALLLGALPPYVYSLVVYKRFEKEGEALNGQ